MKTTLNDLRYVIREALLAEDNYSSTISSELSPDDMELQAQFPKWGSSTTMKAMTPLAIKKHQVGQQLEKMGYTKDAGKKKTIVQQLGDFLKERDPAELFVSDPAELAQQFADDYLT